MWNVSFYKTVFVKTENVDHAFYSLICYHMVYILFVQVLKS